MDRDSPEKRMAGDYEIIFAVHIGDREVVVGEKPGNGNGDKYMCSLGESNGFFELHSEVIASDHYPEIMELFGQLSCTTLSMAFSRTTIRMINTSARLSPAMMLVTAETAAATIRMISMGSFS